MTAKGPKWSRRKEARPSEIIEAALDLFVVNGFAATKLAEVAQRAGVVKGTLYRYFDTKEALFRAAVRHLVVNNLAVIEHAPPEDARVSAVVPVMLRQIAATIGASRIPAIVRMVLAESRAFPDLATIWHGEVVSPMLSAIAAFIATGQDRGEIKAGDPRLHAFSIIGPMVAGALYQEVFGHSDGDWLDLNALAAQHADTVVLGLTQRGNATIHC